MVRLQSFAKTGLLAAAAILKTAGKQRRNNGTTAHISKSPATVGEAFAASRGRGERDQDQIIEIIQIRLFGTGDNRERIGIGAHPTDNAIYARNV